MDSGTYNKRNAAEQTGILFSTLQIRHQKQLYGSPSLGRKTVLSAEVEKEIADAIKNG